VNAASFSGFYDHNIKGYEGGIEADVGTIMTSYSAVNFIPMAFGPYLQAILREKLQFKGLVITDYDEIEKIMVTHLPTSFQIIEDEAQAITMMLAAGNDMFMIPGYYGYRYVE
jgi:beta-glucosidase